MAAPLAAFTVIPLADVDPDSPVSTDLMNGLRLNDQNLFAQLVGDPVAAPPFVPAAAHDHDGVNSKAVSGSNLRLVGATEVSGAAVATISFAGLDGNVDGQYIIYGTIIRGIAGTVTDYQLRFNALAAGYIGAPALTTGIRIFTSFPSTVVGGSLQFKMDVWARNLIQAVNIAQHAKCYGALVDGPPAAAFSSELNQGGLVNIVFPAANLISLDFAAATGGTVFGVGTRIAVYRVTEN